MEDDIKDISQIKIIETLQIKILPEYHKKYYQAISEENIKTSKDLLKLKTLFEEFSKLKYSNCICSRSIG